MYVPEWNRLSYDAQRDHQGLRWYALEPARMYDFAKIHQWAEQLKFWDDALEGLAIGIDDIDLQGECDDPQAWLIKSIDHSVAVFSVILDLENTLWDSHPEIGSSARESLILGKDSAQQALQLINDGPPFVPHELGPLVGDVSSARGAHAHQHRPAVEVRGRSGAVHPAHRLRDRRCGLGARRDLGAARGDGRRATTCIDMLSHLPAATLLGIFIN